MITKTAVGNFGFKSNYYPEYIDETDRQMTSQQRKTLIELIYARIFNPDEIDRRITEIESYNYMDAREAIEDFLFAPWK